MYKKSNICTERLYTCKLQTTDTRYQSRDMCYNSSTMYVNVFTTKKSLKDMKYKISTKFYMSNNYAQLL